MKNITLSAEDNLIEQARLIARARHKTLNTVFREFLEQFTRQEGSAQDYSALMDSLSHVSAGAKFTRDEMNAR
jgi:hypothetical protein